MVSSRVLVERSGNHLLFTLVLVIVVSVCGCGVPAPGGRIDSFGLDFSLPSDARVSGAIIFVIDGVNAEYFEQMLTGGELPAIKKYFADRGLYAPRTVANIPSVTLANLTSIITGKFCGHHGIVGINFFDRNRCIWRNYETIAQKNTLDGDYTSGTLFEQFPDRTTFSIFFQPHRGSTKFIENWTSAGPPFYFGWYEFVDRLTLFRFNIVADVARRRREWPAITVAYLLASDFRAYNDGFSSDQYRESLLHADRQIGRVCGDLERDGLLEKLHLAIVSDHGHEDIVNHFPLEKFLREEVGLKIAHKRFWEETAFEKRLEYYRRFSAVVYGSGDKYVGICLRRPADPYEELNPFASWTLRPSVANLKDYLVFGPRSWVDQLFLNDAWGPLESRKDLLSILTKLPAVDALAYAPAPDRVRVRTKAGEVEFRQDAGAGGAISYHVISGDDSLGWGDKVPKEALDGKAMDPREWLAATLDTDFPDLPAQILAHFRSRYSADIAVFAAPAWDFFNTHRAGHGGLRPNDMFVPLLLAGPGVPVARVEVARTVDLAPTLLHLLGKDIPQGLDGEVLPLLRESSPPVRAASAPDRVSVRSPR